MNSHRLLAAAILSLSLLAAVLSVSAASPPRLVLEKLADQQVRIVWTNTGERIVLQEANTLSKPIPWLPSGEPVTLEGSLYSTVLSFGGSNRYFRLQNVGTLLTTFASSPVHGETGVAVTRETILTFNQPLAENTMLTSSNLHAEFGGRRILSRIELASDRRKATLFYLEEVPASARVRVTFNAFNVADIFNDLIDADRNGVAGGVRVIEFDTLGVTPVAGTAVIGRVFASQLAPNPTNAAQSVNLPLAGVTITVDGAEQTLRTTTDTNGFFRLHPSPAGRFFVHVDGRTVPASQWPTGDYYPVVGKAWEAAAGKTNNLAAGTGEIFLPFIRSGTLQPVSATNDTIITFPSGIIASNPALAGVHIVVPANALFSDNGARGGKVGIAPVPPDRLPEPLPPGLEFPIVITVQTDGGLNFDRPVPVSFPNLPDPVLKTPLPPGSKQALYSFNHDKGIWEAVGSMTVTLDGRFVVSDPGTGILQPGWHADGPPPFGPDPCDSQCCEGGGGGGPPPGPGPGPGPQPQQAEPRLHDPPPEPPPALECLCLSLTLHTVSVEECLEYSDIIFRNHYARCEDDFDQCTPCRAGTAACTACYRRFRRCVKEARNDFHQGQADCLTARSYGCFASPAGGALGLARARRHVLQSASTPQEVIDAAFDQIDQLLLAAGPDGVTPGVQTQIEAILAGANAALGGNLREIQEAGIQAKEADLLARGFFESDFGNAPGYPILYMARVTRPTGTLELRGTTGPFGQYSLFIPRDGHLDEVTFYDPQTKMFGHVHPYLLPELARRLPRVSLFPLDADDIDRDRDGLPDAVEEVYGTNPEIRDTDGDGIPDGAEVEQGTNPLDGRPAITGVIASVDTAGTAMDVCAINNVAVVADGAGGVVIFDASNPFNPVQAAVVPTVAPATAVACSGNLVAVAQGSAGLAVIDITVPGNARKLYDLALGGDARAVAVSGSTAFIGLGNNGVVVVDMPTGTILERASVAERVDDLAVRGDHLFIATVSHLFSYRLDEQLPFASGVPVSFGPDPNTGRRRLFVGTAHALVTSFPGHDVVDIQNPEALQVTGLAVDNRTFNSFKQIVDNGSGLGVVAAGVRSISDGTHHIQLYDLSSPAETTNYLTTLATPGETRAVSIFNGLAYAADGSAGLQVLNYLPYDAQGVPPTITLTPGFALIDPTNGVAEPGKFVTLTANVNDDVQVRNVEFYIDGQLVVTDGNFPFEQAILTPLLTTNKTNFTVRAKATDTGGNFTFTPEIRVRLVPDATAPRVVSRFPLPNSFPGAVETVLIQFNEPLNPASFTPLGVIVTAAGADGMLGTADDALVTGGTLSYRSNENTVVLTFGAGLSSGLHRVQVGSTLTDIAGNIARTAAWTFRVLGTADSDHDGVPDSIEPFLGFNPLNPDSDGDGILDGDEDLDADALPTKWELAFGYDPTKTDTDNNGINDGNEDPDIDGLKNIGELLAGTDFRNPDSDGDDWNDEAEVTGGGNPLNPLVTPNHGFVALPPVKVIAPAVGVTDGLPFSTFAARPPVKVVAPAVGSTDGLPFNTSVAQPPVQVQIQ